MTFSDYESQLSEEQKKLLSAVETGTVQEVQELAKKFENSTKDDTFNYLLLVKALQKEREPTAKYLLEEMDSIKLAIKTGCYCTPLYYAVEMNYLEIFKKLRMNGASIHDKDANEISALELALQKSRYTIIHSLLEDFKVPEKSKTLSPDSKEDIALFHAACWVGNVGAIKMFMSHNFSMNSRSNFDVMEWKGFTPLHFVVMSSTSGALKALLNHDNIDLMAHDERGRTCLNFEFRSNSFYSSMRDTSIELVSHLIGQQYINPVDRNGLGHFHILCHWGAQVPVASKCEDFIKYFIGDGVDVNAAVSLDDEKYPGWTALHFAVKGCSWGILKLLLKNGADPMSTDKRGRTPLHFLCAEEIDKCEQHLEVAKLLILHGADPIAKDSDDQTPLHRAFRTHYYVRELNHLERFLLSQNEQDINHTDKYGISYLHMACTGDDLDIVKKLVANGALVNSCISEDSNCYQDYSPLHFAAETLQVEIVEFLLSCGADSEIDGAGDMKNTPLHLACQFEQLDRPLDDKSKNDKKEDDEIEWLQSRSSQIRIVELLIEYGALVDAENSYGDTPLMRVFEIPEILEESDDLEKNVLESLLSELFTRQQKLMDILLHHGANINARNKVHGSILHVITRNFYACPLNKELAEIVLKKGADVNFAEASQQFTPLHLAVQTSLEYGLDTSLIDLFIKYGANINAKSDRLDTPLHVCLSYADCNHDLEDVLKKLLDHPQIDVNAQNKSKETSLHMAIDELNFFATTKLLEAGADINIEKDDGNIPTDRLVTSLMYRHDLLEDEDNVKLLVSVIVEIKKRLKLKLYVSDKVMNHYEELSQWLEEDGLSRLDGDINKEVEQLKSQKLDNYTSFYDILFKDPTAMSKHIQNKDLLATLLSIYVGWDYPLFGDIIKRQHQKGYNRVIILEPAKKALDFVTNMCWPDICSEKILSNLNDDDLKMLIKTNPLDETREELSDCSPQMEAPPTKIPRYDQ